jgi:hypothetical protein
MVSERSDCRRFCCDECGATAYVCSLCDRGHRYCSGECGSAARCRSQREAGRRYQSTARGRRKHARRQASYRSRQRLLLEKVTHQGSPEVVECSKLEACAASESAAVWSRWQATRASSRAWPVCAFCHQPCAPWVRDDFLRVRRRSPRRLAREVDHDLQGSGG